MHKHNTYGHTHVIWYDQKATPDPSSSSKESYIVMMKDEPILTHDIDTTQSNQERKLNRKRYVDTKISLYDMFN